MRSKTGGGGGGEKGGVWTERDAVSAPTIIPGNPYREQNWTLENQQKKLQ